jgi:hypothetical protein
MSPGASGWRTLAGVGFSPYPHKRTWSRTGGDEDGTWPIARRTAPDRVISTVSPDSRHVLRSVASYRDCLAP